MISGSLIYITHIQKGDTTMKYDAVFIEKECMSGLTVDEITRIYDLLNQDEGFPMEIYNTGAESSAMGFITPSGFDKLVNVNHDDEDDFRECIGNILADMHREHDNYVYDFGEIKIYLTRNI